MAERLPTDAPAKPGQFVRHRELFIGGLIGLMAGGAVAGSVAVFGSAPAQPSPVPCADAAEAWAVQDVNWQVFTLAGSAPLADGEVVVLQERRAEAQILLDECRSEVVR